MMDDSFRILSIDGGGVRGFLSASILAGIERLLDQASGTRLPLGMRFDLIAGTSAGGLIAIGLAIGRTAAELSEWFEGFATRVFSQSNRRGVVKRAIAPSYSPKALHSTLVELFGDQTLRDAKTDLCVTSVSLNDARPRLHKTDYFARNAARMDERLIDIALATSAAPTFFPAHSSKYSVNLVDGGLAANNPSLVALVDAVQFERLSKRGAAPPSLSRRDPSTNPILVSIGTGKAGSLPYDVDNLSNGGWWNWKKAIYEVILLSQASMIHDQITFLLRDRYLRIDPILQDPVALDDAGRFLGLRNRADIDRNSEAFILKNLL